ncbi:MAG: hypothetical protein UY09_C0001G0008 [Parcubacteria group bacterium GW2011_GWA2_47_8]|nr:MAG: hypothetical protein UY09_C0001G0008 [Parcubacteria group bacterium GW2011_GWA2_47_8]
MIKSYVIPFTNTQGVLTHGAVSVQPATPPAPLAVQGDTDVLVSLMSFDNVKLEQVRIPLPTEVIAEHSSELGMTGSIEQLSSFDQNLLVPYHTSGSYIVVNDTVGQELVRIDVSHLGANCGDSICQSLETVVSCQQDCAALSAGAGTLQGGAGASSIVIGTAIGTILLLVVIFTIYRRRLRFH